MSANTISTLFFFFSWFGGHRDLHSFPTRRSSDLLSAAGFCRSPAARGAPMKRGLKHGIRSEEHTSELQSLRHLVCRLLLEKKKADKLREHIYEDRILLCRGDIRLRYNV